jgi:predicted O-methyltransferase YrrM
VSKYTFTADWFSQHIPNWEKYVKPRFSGLDSGKRFLEIGSYEGRSTVWILENLLTNWKDQITCIDHFDAMYRDNFFSNMKAFEPELKVRVLKSDSFHALADLNVSPSRRYDGIYIDGGHRAKETLSDLVLSWPLLRHGGIMIVDDYKYHSDKWPPTPKIETPKPAIDAFLKMYKKELKVVHKGYQVMVEKL